MIKEIGTTDFGHALEWGAEETTNAIDSPKEGTILTVIRHAAENPFHFQGLRRRRSGRARRPRHLLPLGPASRITQ